MSQRDGFEKWWHEPEHFGLRAERFTTPDEAARAAWQASRAAALEEAAKVCDEMADDWNLQAQGARDGRYDFMAEAGDRCADEIRDASRAESNRSPIDGDQCGTTVSVPQSSVICEVAGVTIFGQPDNVVVARAALEASALRTLLRDPVPVSRAPIEGDRPQQYAWRDTGALETDTDGSDND